MSTEETFAFFHRILFLVTKLRLHPFTLRDDLLVNVESRKTRLIGWTTVVLNILYFPVLVASIKGAGKIEGIIHSFLIAALLGCITAKMTIQIYHTELIQLANNLILLNRKLGKTNLT